MSTKEAGASGEPKYRILDAPPPEDAPGPRLQFVPPEEGEEVDDFVIEDLDAGDSPTGGASVRCTGCGCYCIA